ncbi:MAG: ABC transporter permease [Ilumatobacteraceae bacterium]
MSFARYVLRRLALALFSLVVASAVIFTLLRLLPGDIAETKLGVGATPEAVAQLREDLGLDRSVLVQYGEWLGNAVRGDLGESLISEVSVSGELANKSRVTLPLVLASGLLSLLIALPLGLLAALRHRRPDGVALSVASQLGVAVPSFWVGVILITAFAVNRAVLPAGGFPEAGWADGTEAIRSLVLPIVTLTIAQAAVLTRFARSAALDTLSQEFFRTARATGLTRRQALREHGLRNSLLPVVSVLGVQVSTLVVGAIVVESVFALPGIGQMLLQDVAIRDFNKVMGTLVVAMSLVFVVSFVTDLVTGILDPRTTKR